MDDLRGRHVAKGAQSPEPSLLAYCYRSGVRGSLRRRWVAHGVMLRGVRLRQVASQARARSGHGREAIGRPWRGTVASVADAFVALPGEDPDNLKFSPTIRTRVQMSRCPDVQMGWARTSPSFSSSGATRGSAAVWAGSDHLAPHARQSPGQMGDGAS